MRIQGVHEDARSSSISASPLVHKPIDREAIEIVFHEAGTTKNLDLMMSRFAGKEDGL
jgi:hypothetical protein